MRPMHTFISLLGLYKSPRHFFPTSVMRGFLDAISHRRLAVILALNAPIIVGAAETNKTFATPEEAVAAFVTAAEAQDTNALRAVFGPDVTELENPDPVQAANEHAIFVKALSQGTRILHESDTRCVLEVGASGWPFPIPIVKKDGQWFFDTAAGKEEVLNRRIGRNELATLRAVRAYVAAQRQYASLERDGDEVLEYAQRFISSPGTHDGLYWPTDPGGEISPLGPLIAYAQGAASGVEPIAEGTPGPFQGYYFKILTRQGRHAPGGKHDYVINGKMIAGFGLVAWPARYGDSGIMTFIVNQQGRVYQKDLGTKTTRVASEMKTYDPDPTWQVSAD
jgi:hypothetical protein